MVIIFGQYRIYNIIFVPIFLLAIFLLGNLQKGLSSYRGIFAIASIPQLPTILYYFSTCFFWGATFRKVDHHIAGTAMCGRTAIFPQGFCVNKRAVGDLFFTKKRVITSAFWYENRLF